MVVSGAVYSHFNSLASIETKTQAYRDQDKQVYLSVFASKESVSFVKENLIEIKEDVKDLKSNISRDLQEIKRLLAKK